MRSVKFVSLVAVFALSACGPKVTSIELAPGALELGKKGEIKALTATPKDAEKKAVENVQITYTSSDPKVATVDAKGQVSAVDTGEATITAAFEQNKATATVKVAIPGSITFAPADVKLVGVGSKAAVVAKVMDSKGKEMKLSATFVPGDGKVATVAGNEFTAVAAGEATFVATAGDVKSNLKVSVTVPVLTTVEADKALEIAKAGETATIKAMGKDADGKEIAGTAFTFASADEKIAKVDAAGVVTAVKKGKTKVTVTAGDKSATVEVQVKK
ncbi:MAG: Ig-like domain-containing protein [Myxococcales bacterium]